MQTEAESPHYRVGQVWSYKARLPDIGSTLVVVKVDQDDVLGNIVHLSVLNIQMQNPQVPGGITSEFLHLPMAEEAVDQSVVALLREETELPDYREGYAIWRQAFNVQEAGVFTLPVAECIDVIEQTLAGDNGT